MKMFAAVGGIITVLMVATNGAAQNREPALEALSLPSRVRLTNNDGSTLKLELLAIERGGLLVRESGRVLGPSFVVLLADVSAAARSDGGSRGKSAWKGAKIGGAIGGAALLALATLAALSDDTSCGELGCGRAIAATTGIGIGLGATLGGAVGAAIGGEKWMPLDLGKPPTSASRAGDFQRSHARGVHARLGLTIRF